MKTVERAQQSQSDSKLLTDQMKIDKHPLTFNCLQCNVSMIKKGKKNVSNEKEKEFIQIETYYNLDDSDRPKKVWSGTHFQHQRQANLINSGKFSKINPLS